MRLVTLIIFLIEWKQNLIRNDIVWRNRLLPREHHKLDLSVYDPSKYTGTYSTKIANAKSDATTQWPLDKLESLLLKLKSIREAIS